jgi:short-subunit dehydrogenase
VTVRLKPLSEQTIVITGASSGIGLATAREAARRGASLVLAARNAATLAEIAEELRREGVRVAVCPADVAVEADVERIAETAIREFGGFDSWVNDAAAATYGSMEEVPIADHRRIFEVNYFGLLMGSLIAARHLRQRGGAIVNMGSVLSDRSFIYQGAYSASKSAVQAATDALRMELERDRAPVSVTLIKPAAIDTPYPEHARNYMEAPAKLPPLLYDPQLVAEAILYACEHPRRHLYVGGSGYMISLAGRFAPRITDKAMELFGVEVQQSERAPDPRREDNLYEARQEGQEHDDRPRFVRRTSVLLQAQVDPLRVPFTLAAAAVELAGGLKRQLREKKDG